MATKTVRVDIPKLLEGEVGYLLDDHLYVAVSVELTRDPVHSRLTSWVHVRAVNPDGSPIHDAHDQPVETRHTNTCDADGVLDDTINGQSGISIEAIKIALGDDDALMKANDSIRCCYQAASMTGPVDLTHLDLDQSA